MKFLLRQKNNHKKKIIRHLFSYSFSFPRKHGNSFSEIVKYSDIDIFISFSLTIYLCSSKSARA